MPSHLLPANSHFHRKSVRLEYHKGRKAGTPLMSHSLLRPHRYLDFSLQPMSLTHCHQSASAAQPSATLPITSSPLSTDTVPPSPSAKGNFTPHGHVYGPHKQRFDRHQLETQRQKKFCLATLVPFPAELCLVYQKNHPHTMPASSFQPMTALTPRSISARRGPKCPRGDFVPACYDAQAPQKIVARLQVYPGAWNLSGGERDWSERGRDHSE